jgi:AbrB family looped-hinge helix DNA binding protein
MLSPSQELIKVLPKGMITIPKPWRDEFGFNQGDRIKAKKTTRGILIEPMKIPAPYRIYTQREVNSFIKSDRLPKNLKAKLLKKYD